MEGPEVPTEHLLEHLHHEASHGGEGSKWISWVALSSAIIAGLAAIAALMAGMDANVAMIHQMQASDQWNYYQAKGVKGNVLATKIDLLAAMGKTPDKKDQAKLAEYKKEQEAIKTDADGKQKSSEEHLENHEVLARAVTLFQVAIALGAVSALVKRRAYWYVSLGVTVIGAFFLWGAVSTHLKLSHEEAEKEHEAAEHATGGGEKAGHAAAGEHEKAKEEHGKAPESHEAAPAVHEAAPVEAPAH